jgi:disulfide bond formation protein DsbB
LNHNKNWVTIFGAWIVALVASLGALFVGEIMGQTPCLLCWYQRAFMFPLAVILAIAAFRSDIGVGRYALPLAVIGLLISAYHSLLYAGFISEAMQPCGKGPSCANAQMTILGGLPLPALSFAAFAAIIILLIIARRRSFQ